MSQIELMAKIAIQEKIYQHHQAKYKQHQNYFRALQTTVESKVDDYAHYAWIGMFPAFFMGWKMGSRNRFLTHLKYAGSVAYVSALTHAKRHITNYVMRLLNL